MITTLIILVLAVIVLAASGHWIIKLLSNITRALGASEFAAAFILLAVATSGGFSPCGACRQVLFEFAPELPILLIDVDRPEAMVEVNIR
jgi:cytidine deaminase